MWINHWRESRMQNHVQITREIIFACHLHATAIGVFCKEKSHSTFDCFDSNALWGKWWSSDIKRHRSALRKLLVRCRIVIHESYSAAQQTNRSFLLRYIIQRSYISFYSGKHKNIYSSEQHECWGEMAKGKTRNKPSCHFNRSSFFSQ